MLAVVKLGPRGDTEKRLGDAGRHVGDWDIGLYVLEVDEARARRALEIWRPVQDWAIEPFLTAIVANHETAALPLPRLLRREARPLRDPADRSAPRPRAGHPRRARAPAQERPSARGALALTAPRGRDGRADPARRRQEGQEARRGRAGARRARPRRPSRSPDRGRGALRRGGLRRRGAAARLRSDGRVPEEDPLAARVRRSRDPPAPGPRGRRRAPPRGGRERGDDARVRRAGGALPRRRPARRGVHARLARRLRLGPLRGVAHGGRALEGGLGVHRDGRARRRRVRAQADPAAQGVARAGGARARRHGARRARPDRHRRRADAPPRHLTEAQVQGPQEGGRREGAGDRGRPRADQGAARGSTRARPRPRRARIDDARLRRPQLHRRLRRGAQAVRPRRGRQAPEEPAEAGEAGRRREGRRRHEALEGAQEGRAHHREAADPALGNGDVHAAPLAARRAAPLLRGSPAHDPPRASPGLGRLRGRRPRAHLPRRRGLLVRRPRRRGGRARGRARDRDRPRARARRADGGALGRGLRRLRDPAAVPAARPAGPPA